MLHLSVRVMGSGPETGSWCLHLPQRRHVWWAVAATHEVFLQLHNHKFMSVRWFLTLIFFNEMHLVGWCQILELRSLFFLCLLDLNHIYCVSYLSLICQEITVEKCNSGLCCVNPELGHNYCKCEYGRYWYLFSHVCCVVWLTGMARAFTTTTTLALSSRAHGWMARWSQLESTSTLTTDTRVILSTIM